MLDKKSTTFHNEDAVFRIAMWSNIISWLALVLAFFLLVSGISELYTQWDAFLMSVPEAYQRVLIISRVVFAETILSGVFAFLVLQGVSQGLYLAMDFYLEDEDDDEDEDEAAVETED